MLQVDLKKKKRSWQVNRCCYACLPFSVAKFGHVLKKKKKKSRIVYCFINKTSTSKKFLDFVGEKHQQQSVNTGLCMCVRSTIYPCNYIPKKFLHSCSNCFFFIWTRSYHFRESSQIISFSLALFASLQLNWFTTTSRLLGSATCPSHKDGGIPLSVFPNNTTSKLTSLFSTLYFLC